MDERREDPSRSPGRTPHLLRDAGALVEEARRNGADLHPCARHFLQQAELLLASGRIEMGRDDARLAATFARLASEEAGKAIALCGSPRRTWPGSSPRREVRWR
jgi:hypothetical protein